MDTVFWDMQELEPLSPQNEPTLVAAVLKETGWLGWMVGSVSTFLGFFVLLRLLLGIVWSLVRFLTCEVLLNDGWLEGNEAPISQLVAFAGAEPFSVFVVAAWILSALHRLGILLHGSSGPRAQVRFAIGNPPREVSVRLGNRKSTTRCIGSAWEPGSSMGLASVGHSVRARGTSRGAGSGTRRVVSGASSGGAIDFGSGSVRR